MKKSYIQASGSSKKLDVYQTLKDAIQFLEIKPGSPINEAALVKELGVSRTPIREALIRLSDDLLVEIYSQRGTYVSKINLLLAKEMAYLRHIVEKDICLELCKSKADLEDATVESMFLMEQAIKKKDIVGYIVNDGSFHRSIFLYADHELIWNIISNARMHYIRFLMLDMSLPNSLEESFQDHKKIIDSISKGDIKKLNEILNIHHDHRIMKREEQIKQKYSEYFV